MAEKERHPFRFLFKFALFVGIVALIGRAIASKKDEFYGITESEARAKFESKLGSRIGEDKAAEVADQVIPKLKEKGIIKPDPAEEAVDKVQEAGAEAAQAVEDAADDAADTIEEAVEDATG